MGYDQISYSKYEQKWLFISFNSDPFFGKSQMSSEHVRVADCVLVFRSTWPDSRHVFIQTETSIFNMLIP